MGRLRGDMSEYSKQLEANLQRIQGGVHEACEKANRRPDEIKIVAVTKYATLDVVKDIVDLGLSELGESKAQELAARGEAIHEFLSTRARDMQAGAMPRPKWHMVGHLQRNKVRLVLPWVEMIHSVDSLRLGEEISAEAVNRDCEVDVLMQVNSSNEASKFGVAVGAATHLAEMIATLPNVNLCGLMTMAPLTDDRDAIYDCFMRCRELYDEITHEVEVGEHFRHLSMGMSRDFDIAIGCGATILRIGSALTEGLPTTAPATT
ncbi:MAG: YggS family pyridoxal phosphate enzyme [Phycisphaerae bacterium]|nr:MAG: YggS family pyridoxal phosphate enzyme [Phycisphaerae bacterium]